MTRKRGLVFRRAPKWYVSIGWACFLTGGWVLWMNVKLTLMGLALLGVPLAYAQPLGFAMAAIEAAVSIFVTQPENWDDIWTVVQSPINNYSLPRLAKVALSSVVLGLLLAILGGIYFFDFTTTFQGLFKGAEMVTWRFAIIVLAFCLGTEVASFFGFQCLRMSKIAALEVLDENMSIEPRKVYAETLVEHRKNLARMQAQIQIQQEMSQFNQNGAYRPNMSNG